MMKLNTRVKFLSVYYNGEIKQYYMATLKYLDIVNNKGLIQF